LRLVSVAAALVVCLPSVALAGMPSFTLTDVARMRVQTISFFLMALLLSACAIQRLWNYLGKDLAFLPRLSFGKALGVVTLWGLLFVLVLTMISGARELMTPGAWEKQGKTYRLVQAPAAPPSADESLERARENKLDRLRVALWGYSYGHGGHLPKDREVPEIPKDLWELPDGSGLHYIYVSGLLAGKGAKALAYEPDFYGPKRYVLLANGEIRCVDSAALTQTLTTEKP
jgi:hypothetical protein